MSWSDETLGPGYLGRGPNFGFILKNSAGIWHLWANLMPSWVKNCTDRTVHPESRESALLFKAFTLVSKSGVRNIYANFMPYSSWIGLPCLTMWKMSWLQSKHCRGPIATYWISLLVTGLGLDKLPFIFTTFIQQVKWEKNKRCRKIATLELLIWFRSMQEEMRSKVFTISDKIITTDLSSWTSGFSRPEGRH